MDRTKSPYAAGHSMFYEQFEPRIEDIRRRDRLIRAVAELRLRPDQAETQAKRRGLARLAGRPEPGTFDPAGEASWTVPMAFEWIRTGSMFEVEQSSPQYRQQCRDWRYETYFASQRDVQEGERTLKRIVLEINAPITLHDLLHTPRADPYDDEYVFAVKEKAELVEALADNRLPAHGIALGQAFHDLIPPNAWITLDPFQAVEKSALQELHDAVFAPGASQPSFLKVRVRQRDVLRLWPPLSVVELAPQADPLPLASQVGAEPSDPLIPLSEAMPLGFNRDKFRTELEKQTGTKIDRDTARQLHKSHYSKRPLPGRPRKSAQKLA